MQVVAPIDVEDALRLDLSALLPAMRCYAPPATDVRPRDLMVTRTGGAPASAVTHEHDVSIDVWASSDAEAVSLADAACGVVGSLQLRETATEWKGARTMTPYLNPDPDRPLLSRATFTATLTCRGSSIEL